MPTREKVVRLYTKPLMDLVFEAQKRHRMHHVSNVVQKSALLSIKTGKCPEDCSYCAQSAHYETGIKDTELMSVDEVKKKAIEAKHRGATRFCMSSSGTRAKNGEAFDRILEMVRVVKEIGMETCLTMGMLEEDQASRLRESGLEYYNHNIDTSRGHYKKIVTTRKYDDRLETIKRVQSAGIRVCTGGILGMGESQEDRIDFILELSRMNPQPDTVTINRLVPIKGTPLENSKTVQWSEVVRTIATSRILMEKSVIRLSAGRREMSQSEQFLCFLSGVNSIFVGDVLLTVDNVRETEDGAFLKEIGVLSET